MTPIRTVLGYYELSARLSCFGGVCAAVAFRRVWRAGLGELTRAEAAAMVVEKPLAAQSGLIAGSLACWRGDSFVALTLATLAPFEQRSRDNLDQLAGMRGRDLPPITG